MRLFSYVVRRDFGFAPNPFHGLCTLACCKPPIRKTANVGDLIVGTTSTAGDADPRFLYIMRVSEISIFDAYWNDQRFECKRPNLHGSKKQVFGDNIYHRDPETGDWIQEDSQHSNFDGTPHPGHIDRDTGTTENILISDDFVYWGINAIDIPEQFCDGTLGGNIVKHSQGYKCHFPPPFIDKFDAWFRTLEERGVRGKPARWLNLF